MKNETTAKSLEAQPKWQAITSLILGLISIVPAVNIFYLNFSNRGYIWPWPFIAWMYLSSWIFGSIAFILGVVGLKYRTWPLAVTGIVLAIGGFIIYTYLYNVTAPKPPL
jgi:hypothetical protein